MPLANVVGVVALGGVAGRLPEVCARSLFVGIIAKGDDRAVDVVEQLRGGLVVSVTATSDIASPNNNRAVSLGRTVFAYTGQIVAEVKEAVDGHNQHHHHGEESDRRVEHFRELSHFGVASLFTLPRCTMAVTATRKGRSRARTLVRRERRATASLPAIQIHRARGWWPSAHKPPSEIVVLRTLSLGSRH